MYLIIIKNHLKGWIKPLPDRACGAREGSLLKTLTFAVCIAAVVTCRIGANEVTCGNGVDSS